MVKSAIKKSAIKKSAPKKSAIKKSVAKKKPTVDNPVKAGGTKEKAIKKPQKTTALVSGSTANKIILNSVIAINDAKSLYAELGAFLNKKKALTIDASSVEMVDTAILQLFSAFIKKAQLLSVAVTWIKPSKEFLSRAETLNLTGVLGLQKARK